MTEFLLGFCFGVVVVSAFFEWRLERIINKYETEEDTNDFN
jgi:hypothetical protein